MNKNANLVFEVAKWEFKRWFKMKEQIITLLIGVLISLLIFGGKYLVEKLSDDVVEIVVINESTPEFIFEIGREFNINEKETIELEAQKKLLTEENIDGILIIYSIENYELIVNKYPPWLNDIQEAMNGAQQKIKLKQSEISNDQLNDIFKPADIKLNITGLQKEEIGIGEKIAAGIFIGLMLMGVFIGLAYQFVTITGEKQLRITEVVVSAISPQTWIDGKILGISFLSLVMLITYSITSVAFVWVSSLFGSEWSIPVSISNPLLIIGLFVFSLLGFFFWNTFFTAIAATINDPNTSARGSLIMVPVIPVGLAFLALGNPDSLVMKVLSLFPLTSAPVISIRLVLTTVSSIEIIIAIILLVLSSWYLRKAAGKIFSLSILMYGKEPSWKEISKWIKIKGNY